MKIVNIILIICFLLIFIINVHSVTIKTKLGEIKGAKEKSRDGKTYFAFTGIPYAKPPVGKLRFQNPEKVAPWKGILDATNQVSPCIQVPVYVYFLRNLTIGQEDCLYLNVYTPQLGNKKRLPVLVYIHGGGFRCGSPGPKHSPDYFMDEDVVLVSFQYRLGTLGFMSFESKIFPGNYGLKDQVEALRWVKANIEAFGGDENQITIFGESAGGASVHYHLMSPVSRSLIKSGISESGVVNQFWGYGPPGSNRRLAEQISTKFGCNNKEEPKLLECLQQVDAVELARTDVDFLFWESHPVVAFRPVKEPSGEGAFLDFDPLTMETDLPWITGMNKDEGEYFHSALMYQDPAITRQFIDHFDDYINQILYLPKGNIQIPKLIKTKYFRNPITVGNFQEDIIDFVTDSFFAYPMVEAMKRHKGPLYQYLYSYRGASSLIQIFGNNPSLGASHGDEMMLLFNWTELYPKTHPRDIKPSKDLVKMWSYFAKYSIPSTEKIRWPEWRFSQGEYINFNSPVGIGRKLMVDVAEWWSNTLSLESNVNTKLEL